VGRGSKGLRSWKGPWLFSLSEFGPHEHMRITASLAAGAAASILGYMYLGSRYIVLGLRHRKFKVPSVRTSSAFTIRLSYLQSPLTAVPPPGSSMQSCNPCVLPVSLISISRFLQRLFSCCINLMLFAGSACYAALGHLSSAVGRCWTCEPCLML
jgi:hypothetical protein